jgi:hypothetical protein
VVVVVVAHEIASEIVAKLDDRAPRVAVHLGGPRISRMTLAYFEDMGVYFPNYQMAHDSTLRLFVCLLLL